MVRGDALLQARREKLERLRELGVDPYPPRYRRTHTAAEAVSFFLEQEKRLELGKGPAQEGESEGGGDASGQVRTEAVSVAGRIVSLRSMGRAAFLDLRDGSGKVQAHLRRDILGDAFQVSRALDLGDFIGVRGPLFRTNSGEITVEAIEFVPLCKSLRPLPEKYHGLRDVEQRYRQRYLDLISDPEVMEVFRLRGRVISAMRRFLDDRDFVEVDTPVLVPVAAGAMARPFATHHNALDQELYLRIATELYLKRLIVGGFDRVYELGRVFRNEGVDQDHNPEFTLLESYEAYADYNHVMSMVEEMMAQVAMEVLGSTSIMVGDREISLEPPWRRLSLREELLARSGIDIEEHPTGESMGARLRQLGVRSEGSESRGRLIDKALSTFVEPHLIQPTFLLDYPEEMSPLAKGKPDMPGYVERFEGFICGMEVANAYSELNDPDIQRERFEEQERQRREYRDEEVDRTDHDFLLSVEHGMPPTGGLGMGIDRLVMILAGQNTIRDVMLFPQMRTRE